MATPLVMGHFDLLKVVGSWFVTTTSSSIRYKDESTSSVKSNFPCTFFVLCLRTSCFHNLNLSRFTISLTLCNISHWSREGRNGFLKDLLTKFYYLLDLLYHKYLYNLQFLQLKKRKSVEYG